MARKRKLVFFGALALLLAVGAPAASATVVDLTSAGTSGTINGAIYEQIDPQSTGTGVINSFVRLQANGDEEGYNSTNETLDTGATDTFNHAITIGDVPVVNIGGIDYRQFLLDVNETSAAGTQEQYVSLDQVLLFLGGTANSNSTDLSDGGPLGDIVYNMDAGSDSWVALNYALNAGSGSGDMFLYIPDSLFSGYASTDQVVLYSQFGLQGALAEGNGAGVPAGDYGTSDGFEEWAVLTAPEVIPEPTTLSLMGLGLAGLLVRRRARRNKA